MQQFADFVNTLLRLHHADAAASEAQESMEAECKLQKVSVSTARRMLHTYTGHMSTLGLVRGPWCQAFVQGGACHDPADVEHLATTLIR